MNENLQVIKKDGTTEPFLIEKIFKAIGKSATRVSVELTKEELDKIEHIISNELTAYSKVNVARLHNLVEQALDEVNEAVAKS